MQWGANLHSNTLLLCFVSQSSYQLLICYLNFPFCLAGRSRPLSHEVQVHRTKRFLYVMGVLEGRAEDPSDRRLSLQPVHASSVRRRGGFWRSAYRRPGGLRKEEAKESDEQPCPGFQAARRRKPCLHGAFSAVLRTESVHWLARNTEGETARLTRRDSEDATRYAVSVATTRRSPQAQGSATVGFTFAVVWSAGRAPTEKKFTRVSDAERAHDKLEYQNNSLAVDHQSHPQSHSSTSGGTHSALTRSTIVISCQLPYMAR